ncbi:MAG: response regulator [Galactobacillus timonensis]|uniref:response regulator n=1 Tax=Galactobacillus timonensis TaxID=2041840 RepID=UPI000EE96C85|nr:response regulator [Galactobacillus timonensis]MCI6066821.1 response regulator [Galactobacillus timonensis]HCV54872.1 DNA-binding response regulator [Erysipelotrichaceae bacterium]HCW55307.1 DNA-binding response regulator [Erysipelotrichaceae bacterium]
MTYKVLLADDENDVLAVIRRKIDWAALGLEEPCEASNGVEALELAEKVQPDIVMTDIKMPYMDGLELARQLRSLYPDIRIIILSGFDEFEYAKEAVHLNAVEYLLKPVDSDYLTSIFRKITASLDQEHEERQNQKLLEQYYQQSLPLLQENFFTSLVQGHIPQEEIRKYCVSYQISLPGPYYAVAIFHTSSSVLPQGMQYILLVMSVRRLAEEKVSERWQPHFFSFLNNLCMIVSLNSEEEIRDLTDELDRFCRLAKSALKATVTCGIGHPCSTLAEMPESYSGARQAVSYRVIYGSGQAINIAEVAPKESELSATASDQELQNVFKQMKLEDPEELRQAIKRFLDTSIPRSSVAAYHLFIMELIGHLGRFARDNELDLENSFGKDPTTMDLQTRGPETLASWMTDVCLRMQKELSGHRRSSTENIVLKAKDYIQEHYSDPDLNLNSLCRDLGVSTSYFSTIFRRETGQPFVGYLTEFRMNKAAELLISGNEKTYIVATKVGYSDPNYFSYVFRRRYGVSPSKYKGR